MLVEVMDFAFWRKHVPAELKALGFERYRRQDFDPVSRGGTGYCNRVSCPDPKKVTLQRRGASRPGRRGQLRAYTLDCAWDCAAELAKRARMLLEVKR